MVRLFVGNIPHAADETEVRKHFEKANYATTFAQIIRDRGTGHSRGFGFIELDIPVSEGASAKDRMHGTKMGGRTLTVGIANPKVPRHQHVERNQ